MDELKTLCLCLICALLAGCGQSLSYSDVKHQHDLCKRMGLHPISQTIPFSMTGESNVYAVRCYEPNYFAWHAPESVAQLDKQEKQ